MDPPGLLGFFCLLALPTRWNRQPEECGKGDDGACGLVPKGKCEDWEVIWRQRKDGFDVFHNLRSETMLLSLPYIGIELQIQLLYPSMMPSLRERYSHKYPFPVPPSHPALFPPFCSLPVYLHQVCNWSGLDNACSMVPLQRFATFGLNFWMFTCLAFCSIHESILAYKSF